MWEYYCQLCGHVLFGNDLTLCSVDCPGDGMFLQNRETGSVLVRKYNLVLVEEKIWDENDIPSNDPEPDPKNG